MHYLWGPRKLSVSFLCGILKQTRTLCAWAEQDPVLLHQSWLGSEQPKVIDLSEITMAAGLQVSNCNLLRNT